MCASPVGRKDYGQPLEQEHRGRAEQEAPRRQREPLAPWRRDAEHEEEEVAREQVCRLLWRRAGQQGGREEWRTLWAPVRAASGTCCVASMPVATTHLQLQLLNPLCCADAVRKSQAGHEARQDSIHLEQAC